MSRRVRARGTANVWLVLAVASLVPAMAVAQQAPANPVVQPPFSTVDTPADAVRVRDVGWELELAQSAIRGGFHNLAERYYQQIIERTDIGPDVRYRATLGRADALIGQGRGENAAQVLDAVETGRDDAWHLRRGVAHFLVATTAVVGPDVAQREFAAMEEQVRDLRPEVLGRDVAWWFFLRGILVSRSEDRAQADPFFERATAAAASEAERAVFRLARYQAELAATEVTEDAADRLQIDIERLDGKPLGMEFTLQYAVVLYRLGETSRAVNVLKRQRENIPAFEGDKRERTLLLLGLIAGAGTEDGRQAFRELLERGSDPEFQRIALMRLAAATRVESGPATTELKRLITTMLDRPDPHPLTEDLLFFRAELALRERAFEDAEADARALLTRFPASNRLRREALSILASSSWQRLQRYRTAADYIAQIRGLPDIAAEDEARLALLQGECHFRAGRQDNTVEDFRNAAEAYGAVQASGAMPGGDVPGVVLFQRVLSLLNARAIDAAVRVLDDPQSRTGVDPERWWQAEWNLARELQLAGRGTEALHRADAMGPALGVRAELQLRFLWLAAQVSVESARPDETEERIARIRSFLLGPAGAEIPEADRANVLSSASLLAAEARLRDGDREGGRAAIDRLRFEFPDSPASDYSYIIEAGVLAGENKLVEAMQLLLRLADTRQDSRYAPEALYQAALLSIQRGQEEHLLEANRLLDLLAERYPSENYVFQARLKQADVLRSLGRFSGAEAVYRDLEARYPAHGDRAIVQISLAGALMAQSSTEPGKFDGAVSRYERLMASETLPPDLRVEAGVRLAEGWQAQGNPGRAAEICWEIHRRFIEDPAMASRLGATGPWWISRALFLLGEIEERENRQDNARRLYQSLVDRGLPGDKIARAKIAKIDAPSGGGG